MQLFVDLDGVLADFDAGYERVFGYRPSKLTDNVDWNAIRSQFNFYAGLPPMNDYMQLWTYIRHHHPIILTGLPFSIEEASDNKRAWVKRWIGETVEVRCTRSKDKYLHARPGDILIDDWERHRDRWINQGGVWITHQTAATTIAALRNMGL
jgi:phosphoglycolate phosphatase-like HAD superfamily hydrolase